MSVSRQQYQTYPGGKRHSQQPPRIAPTSPAAGAVAPTPSSNNHEEVVRFVHEAWMRATREDPNDPDAQVTYFQVKEPNPHLKDFKPVDLEAFCERRRVERSAKNSS